MKPDSTTTHYSVCMAVYKNDYPEWFRTAVDSMLMQTIQPSELLLVVDGPIGEGLEKEITAIQQRFSPFQVIRFATNRGLAAGRQAALEAAHNDIVAFMDSDDIAVADRMEQQLNYLSAHPEVSVIGGQMDEFIGSPTHIVGKRIVPTENADILRYMKSRCPMNMVTITARKSALLSVGGFQDWHYNEDFYLWIRLALAGAVFHNLGTTLVHVRVGEEMYGRRGGWKYFKSERGIQRLMLRNHLISLPRYCYNVMGRFIIQVLLTNSIRGFVFRTFFRKQ